MKLFLGVDLGSTTTKAVALDEAGIILGRGITYTRANFEAACTTARANALADARFAMLPRRLSHGSRTVDPPEGLVERARSIHQRLTRDARIAATRKGCLDGARNTPGLVPAIEQVFRQLADLPLPEGDGLDDVAGHVPDIAAPVSEKLGVSYDQLLANFDRTNLGVESRPPIVPEADSLAELRRQAPNSAFREAIDRVIEEPLEVAGAAGTGYGRHRLPFDKKQVRSEILCHGMGAHHAFPDTRTVLDIGGQDTKAIQLDDRGLVTTFQMNDRCAAGCGRYLGYVAEELGMGISDLAPLASRSNCPSPINSTCTVFAGAEIRERLSLGEKREDVVAGLHRAIIQRAMALLARSGGVKNQLTFTGGVARNGAAVAFLRTAISTNYGGLTVNVSPDGIFNGALGAALFARMEVPQA